MGLPAEGMLRLRALQQWLCGAACNLHVLILFLDNKYADDCNTIYAVAEEANKTVGLFLFASGSAFGKVFVMSRASTMDVLDARRIVIQGVTGAGKSTAAREWAELKNLHAIDFDNDVLWMPAEQSPWTLFSPKEQRERVLEQMKSQAWVMASCGSKVTDIVYPQTDVILYLDYSPWVSLSRLFKRTMSRSFLGQTCCNGNRESFRLSLLSKDSIFLWWIKTWRSRRDLARTMESDPTVPPVYRLSHPRQFQDLLHYAATLTDL